MKDETKNTWYQEESLTKRMHARFSKGNFEVLWRHDGDNKDTTKTGSSHYITNFCYKGGICISEREKQVKYKITMFKKSLLIEYQKIQVNLRFYTIFSSSSGEIGMSFAWYILLDKKIDLSGLPGHL